MLTLLYKEHYQLLNHQTNWILREFCSKMFMLHRLFIVFRPNTASNITGEILIRA